MAQLIATTSWVHLKTQGSPFTVTLAQAATAGSTLIFVCAGGAIATASGYTKRTTYGNGTQDVSVSDKVASGGETTISVTLGGSGENVSGIVYEFGPGLTFVGASNNGTGTTIQQSADYQILPSSSVAVTSAAIAIGIWSIANATAYSASNRWRQMGPSGVLYGSGANQPGVNFQFIWASGVADIDQTHQYPQTLAAGNYKATSTYFQSGTGFVAQALYSDTSGIKVNPTPNPIVVENRLPGTYFGNWFGGSATDSTIAGYTDKCSYNPGDTVNFKVDSTGNPFRVEIYRLGFYGWDSFSARNVLGNQAGYITGTVTAQSAPTVDGTLGSISCAWTTNGSWTIPADAPSGVYYVLFRRTDVTTHFASCNFTVKATSVAGKLMIVLPDTTYQAYNVWGATTDNGVLGAGTWTGRSLYQAGSDGATANFAHRAYAVSFDRPYSVQSTNAPTYLTDSPQGVITFLEACGYNIAYMSVVDLEGNSTGLNTASLVFLLGHHEYWTTNMYDAFRNAIAASVNMLVCSSNTGGWHTRFAAADTNHRTVICYKDSGTADVSAGWSGTGYDPVSYTGSWRDARQNAGTVNNTDIRRENALTGQLFDVSGPVSQVMLVPFASKGSPIWRNSTSIQALTSGQSYTTPIKCVGYEVDCADGSAGQPSNLVALNPNTTSFTTGANAAGTIYSTTVNIPVGFTLYRATSGSLVFNTGSWRGFWSVSRWQGSSFAGNAVDVNWQNAFLAILYDLGQIPVTLQSQEPGSDTDLTNPATNAPTGGRTGVAMAYGLKALPMSAFLNYF